MNFYKKPTSHDQESMKSSKQDLKETRDFFGNFYMMDKTYKKDIQMDESEKGEQGNSGVTDGFIF